MSSLFVDRSLEEIRFWSQIMHEHALFLRLGCTVEQTQLIQEADQFSRSFENIHKRADSFDTGAEREVIARFNMEVYQATSHLWTFKRKVLELILSCKITTNLYPSFVDHMSREAAYVMSRIEQVNRGMLEPLPDAIINENIFFLRVMSDHSKFIAHMLDPSERLLIADATDVSYQFEQLLFQAVDLESMRPASQTAATLTRFLADSRTAVQTLRELQETMRDLLTACRLRSVIHPLLAEHMLRETNHFLHLLDRLEASLSAGPDTK
jgi:hypothetical protein